MNHPLKYPYTDMDHRPPKKKYKRRAVMKLLHRKTRVTQEKWPRIENWYWCPMSTIEKRIKAESPDPIPPLVNRAYGSPISPQERAYMNYQKWLKSQKAVHSRLAHHCKDGKIRAIWAEYYHLKSRKIIIKGRCNRECCEEELTPGIKAIMILQLER